VRFNNVSANRVTINTRPLSALGDGMDLIANEPPVVFGDDGPMGPAHNQWFAIASAPGTPISIVEIMGDA
jgi:hypothetical protein